MDSADSLHLQIEAMKLAFADVWRNVADPATMKVTTAQMLDAGYLAARAKLIDMKRTQEHTAGIPRDGGTVYLTTADEKRDDALVHPVQLQGLRLRHRRAGHRHQPAEPRRAASRSSPGIPNQVGPRKRPFHTIIPGFLTRDGQPVMSFGVMGGNMQPQGHMQMITRLVDYNQNPQACSDAPRWIVNPDFTREPRGRAARAR